MRQYLIFPACGVFLWQDTSKCFYPGGNINTLQASLDGLVLYSGSSNGRTYRLGRFCWIISAAVMNAAASNVFLRLDALVGMDSPGFAECGWRR